MGQDNCFPVESRNIGMERTKFKICKIDTTQTEKKKKKDGIRNPENTS